MGAGIRRSIRVFGAVPAWDSAWYWSSSSCAVSPGYAWQVGFHGDYDNGRVEINGVDEASRDLVRAVRSGP